LKLKPIPSREYRALSLPLAAANVLKGQETLALDRIVEAAECLDIGSGMVTGPLGAVDETRGERRHTTIRILLCD
jgi:hypothetical protein